MADIERQPNALADAHRSMREGRHQSHHGSASFDDDVKKSSPGNDGTVIPAPLDVEAANEKDIESGSSFYDKYRPFILTALACTILGWWVSSIIVHAARHRWVRRSHPCGRASDLLTVIRSSKPFGRGRSSCAYKRFLLISSAECGFDPSNLRSLIYIFIYLFY